METGQIINVNGAGVVFSQEAATGLAFVDSSVTPNRAYFAGQYRDGNTAYTT